MKKNKLLPGNVVAAAFFLLIFSSCSKSGNTNSPAVVPPALITNTALNITATSATLGGTVTSLGNVIINSQGVCISLNPNPTITDTHEFTTGSGLGYFSITTSVALNPNTLYHVRAFLQTTNSVFYGNDISFTTLNAVNSLTLTPTEILTKSVKLLGHTDVAPGITITEQGFCLKTSPGPTVSDIKIQANLSLDFDASYIFLQPNTVYYERTYTFYNGQYHYGNEVNFRTTGYLGASGGYVFYDKGQVANGWRYLEIGPVELNYDITLGPGAKWGCSGSMVGQTTPDFGTGLENTNRIVAQCSDPNSAARLCKNYSVNGVTGWFLPSTNEIQMMFNSLVPINHPWNGCWSSTEYNATLAFRTYNSGPPPTSNTIYMTKDINYTVWPIRRF